MKLFSCATELSMEFQLLMKTKLLNFALTLKAPRKKNASENVVC